MINLALVLTISRIFLAPVIIFFMLYQNYVHAAIFFLIALMTDVLDGFVAQKLNQQTKFGAMLDPLADKILFGSIMISLLWSLQNVAFMFRFALYFLIVKELILLVGAGVLWFFYKKFIKPSSLSRVVSFCEAALLILLFLNFLVAVPAWIFFSLILINIFVSVWLLTRYTQIVFFISK